MHALGAPCATSEYITRARYAPSVHAHTGTITTREDPLTTAHTTGAPSATFLNSRPTHVSPTHVRRDRSHPFSSGDRLLARQETQQRALRSVDAHWSIHDPRASPVEWHLISRRILADNVLSGGNTRPWVLEPMTGAPPARPAAMRAAWAVRRTRRLPSLIASEAESPAGYRVFHDGKRVLNVAECYKSDTR